MNQYNIQSYFKSLCKTYCIARGQLKRTKKEMADLGKEYLTAEEFSGANKQFERDKSFWSRTINNLSEEIERVIFTLTYNEQSIIVTTEEEIIALTTFFYVNGISKFKVINMDEKYLDLLPSGKEFHIAFLEAYSDEDEKAMDKIYERYVR